MNENKILAAQRDRLTRYIFECTGDKLYADYCCGEMRSGRCPYHVQPYSERTFEICAPCILNMIGRDVTTQSNPYFSLLVQHHMLVSYTVSGGEVETGRVQSMGNRTITIKVGHKLKSYHLQEIDLIVPKEVLYWKHGRLVPVIWKDTCTEPEQAPIPYGDIPACLQSIGIQPFMTGATELTTAIHLIIEDPTLLEQLGKRLYPAVAEKTGGKVSTTGIHINKLIAAATRASYDTGRYDSFYRTIPGAGRVINVKAFLRSFLAYARLLPTPGLQAEIETQDS